MKIEIKVPAMGESITEATIGTILKPSGSAVNTDDEILELETDKVNQVIYAPQTGTLTLLVSPDQAVKIGEVIGHIETQPEVAPALAAPKPSAPKEHKAPPSPSPESQGEERAARLTKEAFVSEVKGTSLAEPKADIPTTSPSPTSERETRRRLSKLRRVIAERLVQAQQTSAMLTTFNEVDMTQIMALREKYKESFIKKHEVRLGLMSFFIKAVVSALIAYPDFNSYLEGDEIVHREYYDIGVAVGTDKGLFVPVIRHCDRLSFAEIEKALESFARRAKEGVLSVDDLQGGGFTITNGGVYGSLLSTPILNPPQVGILGMHKIQKRPVVIEDQIVIRPIMYLALSYDHRIVDGKEAVSFLVHIKEILEDPARLLLDD
jgi:2-oxoglutarate dehydrogenase E2 component (dihydrolipoamide succinyltransferase)